MRRPPRETVRSNGHTFFVSSQTVGRKPFFRHERWANLLQEIFQHYRGNSYLLHAYVIMPDHFHLIISPGTSLERTMQNIKGGLKHNPVKNKLCSSSEEYRYLAVSLDPIPQRLKPSRLAGSDGGAEASPLQKPHPVIPTKPVKSEHPRSTTRISANQTEESNAT